MSRSAMATTATLVTGFVLGATVLPAQAVGLSDLTPSQIEKYGSRYMSISCPTNKALIRYNRIAHRAFGSSRVATGTPIPKIYKKASGKMAKIYSRAAVRMNRTNWPAPIATDASEVEKSYYKAAPIYLARSEAHRFGPRLDADRFYTVTGPATRIRRALELPPTSTTVGCRRY